MARRKRYSTEFKQQALQRANEPLDWEISRSFSEITGAFWSKQDENSWQRKCGLNWTIALILPLPRLPQQILLG
jgi:hypothetical protein